MTEDIGTALAFGIVAVLYGLERLGTWLYNRKGRCTW